MSSCDNCGVPVDREPSVLCDECGNPADPSREAMREALELFERYCSENAHSETTSWESVVAAARAALALDGDAK